MIPTKPYLIRAIHEWCLDQGFVPYLTVVVDAATRVPREFVRDGEITLNVGHEATHQLMMGNEEITFQARFGGSPFHVVVPVRAVAAIFARENGQGMAFEIDETGTEAVAVPAADMAEAEAPDPEPPKRPHLTRVK